MPARYRKSAAEIIAEARLDAICGGYTTEAEIYGYTMSALSYRLDRLNEENGRLEAKAAKRQAVMA